MKNPINAIFVYGKMMGVIEQQFNSLKPNKNPDDEDAYEEIKYLRVVITHETLDEFGRPDYKDIQIKLPKARRAELENACKAFQGKHVVFQAELAKDNKLTVSEVLNIQLQQAQQTTKTASA